MAMESDKVGTNCDTDLFSEDVQARADSEKLGTLADQRDMYRMGKVPKLRVSQLPVVPSIENSLELAKLRFLLHLWLFHDIAFDMGNASRVVPIPQCRYSATYSHNSSAIFALPNGGTAGLVYVYIGTVIGFAAVVASMAEMASM